MIRRLKTEYFQWLFFNRCNRNKIIKDTRDDAWAGTLIKLQKGYIALMKKFTRKTKRFYYQSSFTQGASNLPSLQTEMLSNSSDALDSLCYVYAYRNFSISSNYWTTVVTSVFAFLLAPMTATGNAFVLAAIWGNPALRTPSHVLLAGLAFTDFCTGLISLPVMAAYKLAHLWESSMTCTLVLISFSVSNFFTCLIVAVIAMAAAERWLCMSRRSLRTVRQVIILYIIIVSLITTSAFSVLGIYRRT